MADYGSTTLTKDDTQVAERFPNVCDYIIQQETAFKTDNISLGSSWNWNMWKHIDRSFLFKNSQFTEDNNTQEKTKKPFNNIIIPILNVAYRTEGFDVKDVELYVDNKDYYHLSLLGRKYHNKWAIENSIDTVIDESVESYADYGLVMVKNTNEKKPIIIKLKTQLAFCDQTDALSGPICLKHEYSIDEMMDMKGKWNTGKIDEAILYAKFSKKNTGIEGQEAKTPGKNVCVYELHGMFPENWIGDKLGEDWVDTGKYVRQMHIVTYYVGGDGKKNGICLFKGKQKQLFKALKRDEVEGRACGRGGIEEIFHAQIWTNFSDIHLMQILEATSKVLLKTTDKKLKNQKMSNMKHGQIIDIEDGKMLEQLVIQPFNKTAFDNFVNKWEQVARTIGSASDPQLGLNPVSGTPLGTTQIVTNQGQGVHEYRQGKLATFWGEIYRDWVLNYLKDDMNRGDEWLDELNLDELQEVAEKISIKHSNKRIKDMILSGKMPTMEEQDMMRRIIKEEFMKGGKRKFLKIIKDEFADLPIKLRFNIKGKQKNLAENISKLNSIFRAVFTPQGVQMLQSNSGLAELFNDILEQSGLSPVNFIGLTKPTISPIQQSQLSKPEMVGQTKTVV